MFRKMRRFKQQVSDEEYIRHEVEFALPRAQCLELIPEHITGKLVNES